MKNILKLYWKITMYLFPIIGLTFFIISNNNSISCQESYEIEKSVSYSGVVQKKYIDKMNHMNKTIELINIQGENIIIFNYDKSGAFNFIKSNDSVFKKKGSYDLVVNRKGEIIVFKIDYKCKK